MRRAPPLLLILALLAGCATVPIRKPETLDHFEAVVRTPDGWELSLFRWRPTGGTAGGVPVILAHGTAVNRLCFLAEGSHWADYLSSRGFDVWIPEYRGDRSSSPPDSRTWKQGLWGVDDISQRDLPAVLDHVLAATGEERVWWVGHSLGGLLGMILLQGPQADRIAGLVTLGSPGAIAHLGAAGEEAHRMSALVPKRGPIPARGVGRALLPTLDMAPDDRLFHALFNLENVDQRVMVSFVGPGMEDVGRGTWQQYGDWMQSGRVTSADGAVDYTAGLANIRVPALVLAGRVDHTVAPWTVLAGYDALGSDDKRFVVLGRGWGQRFDYGHGDLLMGDWVEEEVLPQVADWIEVRLSGAPPLQPTPQEPAEEPSQELQPPKSPVLESSGPAWELRGLEGGGWGEQKSDEDD
jgi:pimeloyl-ACP methyl ester carboxylesterase